MVKPVRRYGQRVFKDILTQFDVRTAFVPTYDEFFLSHALDVEAALKNQAYFFVDGGKVAPPAILGDLIYRLAEPSDSEAVRLISAHDNFDENIDNDQIYIGHLKGEAVTVGIIIQDNLLDQYASIGMFVHEKHRQRGIGACTIIYLKATCDELGFIPVAGCGYDNTNSKKTLEAAGMVTATRLLKFEFQQSD